MSGRLRASIVVPAYNAASTIDQQLAALATQESDGEWEIIVADNGSSDSTADRARAWSDRLPRLRVLDASTRRGPSAARNIAASQAHGEVLLFCDADDVADRNWASALVAALETADAASGSRRYDLLNTAPFGPSDWPEPTFTKKPLTHLPAASSHNLGLRAEAFAAVGGFDEAMRAGEDVDLCWRLQLSGYRLVGAPDAIMQIRRRTGLLATYRQALSYGRADRILEAKFAGIAVTEPQPPAAAQGSITATPKGIRSKLRERGWRIPDPVFAVDRWGRQWGRRFGSVGDVTPFTLPAGAEEQRREDDST